MDFLSIDNVLFTIGGQNVSLLELFSTVSGLVCVFFASRGKSFNFWIGYFYTALLFLLFMQKHLYSSMLLQPVSLVLTVFGHYRWTHPKQGEETNRQNQLKVTVLKKSRRMFHIALVIAGGAVWGFVLSKLGSIFPDTFHPARLPFLDATITMFILTAQYLSAQKKLECWAAWLTVNVTNLTQYLLVGLIFMPAVCLGYIIFAIMGIKTWTKEYRDTITQQKNIKKCYK
ncbi:MAG: nicotinamide riboside transporter PnuC [Prevotellaceae bacterium]|jgi:nicotinamide mononucleotide transporter|nr:nicotinamide riboside transporter PnuC [Prevotellaceae bacterium]